MMESAFNDRLFHIYHTVWQHDYNVMTSTKTQLFHVDNSSIRPKKPDLTIYAGADNTAPVVAVGKFLHFSRHFKIGLGDPQRYSSVAWEDLVCQGFVHPKYHIKWTVRDGRQNFRLSLVWKRTNSVGVEGSSPSMLGGRNYKLVDENSDQVVAIFTNSAYSYKKAGKLQVCVNYGQEFDLMVILTALCLYEKQRRQNNNAAGSSGGGGGGG